MSPRACKQAIVEPCRKDKPMSKHMPEALATHVLARLLAPVVVLKGLTITSGTLPDVKDGQTISDSPFDQLREAFMNMTLCLTMSNKKADDLVYVLVFTTEPLNNCARAVCGGHEVFQVAGIYQQINEIWQSSILSRLSPDSDKPGRAVIGVRELPMGAKFEVIGICR